MPHDLSPLVGMPLTEAHDWVLMRYLTLRVMNLDGEPQIGDCRVYRTRVNVAVENGIITEVIGYG